MNPSWLPQNRWMRRVLLAGIVVYAWTVFGMLSSAHFLLGEEARGQRALLADIAGHVLVFYWAWAAVTPLVLAALRRMVRQDLRVGRRWLLLLLATPAIVAVHGVVYLLAVRLFGVERMSPIGAAELADYAMRHAGGDLATVGVLTAAYLLLDARQRAHVREVESAALEARAAAADLEVLRLQLQPHFLFNALNTVSTLVLRGDNESADDAIGRISRYLRTALSQRADALVLVGQEISDVQQYFAIERLRFGEALCLDVRVDDGARDVRMPAILVQPLVENALRHGTTLGTSAARIGISATVRGDRLELQVRNRSNGGAVALEPEENPDGFGLRYVRERLHHFYGEDASLTLDTSGAETFATVSVPLEPRSLMVQR